ncbi:MAG: PilZ domain-containing protein [Acidobacteriota bacterium]
MSDQHERREEARIERVQLVQLTRFDEEGFRADLTTGRTLNLSVGGMRLELTHPVPLRSLVTLSLVLDGAIVELNGRVAYLEVLDDTRCAMGISCVDLPAHTRERIDAFLAERAAPESSS